MQKEIIIRYIVDVPDDFKEEHLEEAAIVLGMHGKNAEDIEFVYDESADIFYSVEEATMQIDGGKERDIDDVNDEFMTEERMEIFNKKHR